MALAGPWALWNPAPAPFEGSLLGEDLVVDYRKGVCLALG